MKIYLSSKGLKPNIDCSGIINRQIELAKPNTIMVVPYGEWYLYKSLVITSKPIHWESADGSGATFLIYHDKQGLILSNAQGNSVPEFSHIININFVNRFPNENKNQHGIECHIPLKMRDCTIDTFSGNGIHLTADINTFPGSNVSHCQFDSCRVRMNRGSGVFCQGGDSNWIVLDKLDCRDNWRYGVEDNSFLGIVVANSMAHNNYRGNYCSTGLNSYSTFTACYSEGGSPLSFFKGATQLDGGLWSGGVILEDNAAANIHGKRYTKDTQEWYTTQTHYEPYSGKHIKIFERVGAIDFQWRVYNDDWSFVDKSFEPILTMSDSVNGAKDYINNLS